MAPWDAVSNFVFRYHVHLFFFVSGFFYVRKKELPFVQYILNNVRTILIPYAIFCVLNIIFVVVTSGGGISFYIKQAFLGIRNQTDFGTQLWFFTCLFTIQLIYYFLDKIARYKTILLLITFTSAILSGVILKMPDHPAMFFNIDSALYFTFFYCLGDIVYPKLKKISFSEINGLQKALISAFIVVIMVSTFIIYALPNDVNSIITHVLKLININSFDAYLLQLSILIISVTLICCNIILSFAFKNSKYLSYLGRNTLILCGLESISASSIIAIFAFVGVTIKTTSVLTKIIYMFLKVEVIRRLFLPLTGNSLSLVMGRSAYRSPSSNPSSKYLSD